jgi:hypothetical protein
MFFVDYFSGTSSRDEPFFKFAGSGRSPVYSTLPEAAAAISRISIRRSSRCEKRIGSVAGEQYLRHDGDRHGKPQRAMFGLLVLYSTSRRNCRAHSAFAVLLTLFLVRCSGTSRGMRQSLSVSRATPQGAHSQNVIATSGTLQHMMMLTFTMQKTAVSGRGF